MLLQVVCLLTLPVLPPDISHRTPHAREPLVRCSWKETSIVNDHYLPTSDKLPCTLRQDDQLLHAPRRPYRCPNGSSAPSGTRSNEPQELPLHPLLLAEHPALHPGPRAAPRPPSPALSAHGKPAPNTEQIQHALPQNSMTLADNKE